MTRNEAKHKLDMAMDGRSGQFRRLEMMRVIDEIFDHFENCTKVSDGGKLTIGEIEIDTCDAVYICSKKD